MVLLYATDVGDAAWQRMARDGVVRQLRPGVGHEATMVPSAALRAASLANAVPRKGTLSGACALWVHGWRADDWAPPHIDVTVPRGCHPDPPQGFGAPWWRFLTDRAACESAILLGGVSVARVGSALRQVLCTAELGDAMAAAWWALSEKHVDHDMMIAAIACEGRGIGRVRALAAWNAVSAAAGAPQPRRAVRRAPVMRRAS